MRKNKWIGIAGFVTAAFMFTSGAGRSQTNIVYPDSSAEIKRQQRDIIELLVMAMKKTETRFGAYSVLPSRLKMNTERAMAELKSSDLINVAFSPTSEKLEQEFIPIRIPLRKGLTGFRIALIDTSKQSAMSKIETLDDLKKFRIGTAIGWIDSGVLRANHMQTVEANYDALFAMSAHDRFDLFPLGINEVFDEYELHRGADPRLTIENSLVIYYPSPCYFFVNRRDPKLAERLRIGLEQMIADGTFDRIFAKYNNEALQRADLQHRRILILDNPTLPKETPGDPRYWLFPELMKGHVNNTIKMPVELK